MRKSISICVILASLASGCTTLRSDNNRVDNESDSYLSGNEHADVDIEQWQKVSGSEVPNQSGSAKFPYTEESRQLEELDNFYYTDQSNFESLFARYNLVVRHDIIFPNDSMNLGSAGKARVRAILPDFDSETDIVSLIGCSHGKTSAVGGNQALALERVKRLQQELISIGIDKEKIFSEGCWAPVYFDRFPRRGVVVSILRQQ